MPEFCPLCLSKGKRTPLKFLQMNLSEATKMCIDMKCPYPLGLQYADTFIKMDFVKVIADESIKLDVKNFPHIGSGPQNVGSILVSKSEPDNDKFHSSELSTSDQASLNENKLNETDIMDFKLDDFITSNVNPSDFDINAVIENILQNGIDEMLLDNNKEELVIENNKTKDFDTLLESNKNSIVRTTGNVSSEGYLNMPMRETKENLSHSVLDPCCSEFVDHSTENSETNPKNSMQDEILTRNCEGQIFPAFLNHTEIVNSYDVAIYTFESPMTDDNKSAIMLEEKVSGDDEHTIKSEASTLSENIPVEAGRVTKYVEPTKEGTLDLKHNDSFEKSPQIVNNIQVTDSSGPLKNNDEFLIHKTFFTTDKVKEVSKVTNTYCLPREMLEHSYYKMVGEIPPKDLNTNIDSSDITGNRDVMVLGIDDIEGTGSSSFVTNSESVECLSIGKSDMYIAENVAVASCGTNSKVEVITGVKERISILKDNDSKTEFHCKTDTEVRDDNAIVDNTKLPVNILKVSNNPMTVVPEKLKAENVSDHITSELTRTRDDTHTSKSRESAFVSIGTLEKVALVEKTGRAEVQNSTYDRKNDEIMINSKKAFSGEVCLSDIPSVKVSSSSRVVKIGEESNMIVVKCRECIHTPKCDNLGKDVSVVYIQQNNLPQATALESNTVSDGLSRKLQSVSAQSQQLTHSQPLSLEVTSDSISSVPKKLCVTQPVPLESNITYCGSSASQQKKANRKKITPIDHNTGITLTEQLGELSSGEQTEQKQNELSLVLSKSTNEMVLRNVQQRKLDTRKLNLGKDKSLKVMFELRKNFDTERFAGFTFESASVPNSKKTPPGRKPSRIIERTNSKERKRKKEKSVVSRPSRNNLNPNIFHIHSDNQEHTNVENCIDEYIVNTNVSSLCVRTESNANNTQDWIEELLK
ncbi:serine-rich adhesin for platelets-like isoform X2 [Periplaneta americana]